MSSYLPKSKVSYLFHRISNLIANLLIEYLPIMKKFSKQGILKINRNIFALQQNITNIIVGKDLNWNDSVRRYYNLLNLTQKELFEQVSENKKYFTFDQYKQLFLIETPYHPALSEDSIKNLEKIWNNSL